MRDFNDVPVRAGPEHVSQLASVGPTLSPTDPIPQQRLLRGRGDRLTPEDRLCNLT
ncbi:hypothetical protein [Hydrogenophaga sp.]|uniref:hypothetical protein n=1 Tax=Hydrogenophaga sp. TaxID=1904254 RepID=UPI002FCC6BD7